MSADCRYLVFPDKTVKLYHRDANPIERWDMTLLTNEQKRRLLANGEFNALRITRGKQPHDFRPVVKLFCPWGSALWLLTELDPKNPDNAFGLCDLGLGSPKCRFVSMGELIACRGPGGLLIQRDRHFRPRMSLKAYAEAAHRARRIIA